MAIRVAMFPRGIDGLFLRLLPDDGVELVALVQRGTPEDAWARSFLPPARCVPFELPVDLGPCPTTEDLLARSNIASTLAEHGIDALLLSAACTPGTHAWGARHGIRLWMVEYDEQRRLEDKIWFDAFLRRHAVPVPRGGPLRIDRQVRFPFRGEAVLQLRDSLGGEGTYFVDGADGARALVDDGILHHGTRYLVRQRVRGEAYGVTIVVAPGRVALSAVRRQCYYPREKGSASTSRVFAGIQWVPSRALSARLRRRVNRVFLRLGDLLYTRRTFGFANVDFMVDADERVFVIECNPRMSAATPQLLHVPELLSRDIGSSFVRGFTERRIFRRDPVRTPLPDSSYEGATLDLVATRATSVRRAFESGVYRAVPATRGFERATPDVTQLDGPNDVCLISMARQGQTCRPADTLAEVVSNAPLYDAHGKMTDHARRVSSFFRYTDDRP